jgi:hypothetical protein
MIDPALTAAHNRIDTRLQRLRTGRLFVELHVLGGYVIDCRITENRTTEREVRRVMEETPRGRRNRADGER